jgi:alpha,alpha-trehalose phosphorylase (configuration-retaining)
MTSSNIELGGQGPIGDTINQAAAENEGSHRIPAEDLLARVGGAALPPAVIGRSPDEYVSYSHPSDVTRKTLDTRTNEVLVHSDTTMADRIRLAEEIGPWAVRDLERVITEAESLQGVTVGNVNPTANGGGVQYWLANRLPVSRELGIDERWLLMPDDPDAFRVTKDWHNNTQGVAVPGMTHEDLAAGIPVYEAWIRDAVEPALRNGLASVDMAYIHDPQPHGLYDFMPKDQPTIWQSHIENRRDLIADPSSIQHAIWKYMWEDKAERANVHLFHPVDSFVPYTVPIETRGFAPAPFEPSDELNRPFNEQERSVKREFWDGQMRSSEHRKPAEKPAGLPEWVDWDKEDWSQTEIDWDRPMATVIARFDPAKNLVDIDGHASVLEHYDRYRQMMIAEGQKDKICQLVIVGNGSIDDPDGEAMLAQVMHARATKYKAFKDDIKVARVPHDDLAINVLMDESEFGLQPSRREGFENRVSEWTWHRKPVIVADRGGMPLQVLDGKTGFIEGAHHSEAWAARMVGLSTSAAIKDVLGLYIDNLRLKHSYREFSTVYAGFRTYMHYNRALKGMYRGDRRWRTRETMGLITSAA